MYKLKSPNIYASELADFLGSKLIGKDFIVKHPSSLNNFQHNSFFYLNEDDALPIKRLKRYNDILILTSEKIEKLYDNASIIVVKNPRLQFIKIVNEFYVEMMPIKIAESAKINKGARIGRGVSIGENAVIGPEVSIGNNTKILNNVVITGRVAISNNCFIKDNSTIGSEGYDFELDNGVPVHFPHIGKILIGNNVWIGANTTIENSAIDDTVIEDNVKIDDFVHIGASCIIRKDSMITAGTILSRGVVIGKNCLLAPNVCVRDEVKIGKNVTVGIGAVVIRNLDENGVYVGNPAHLLRKK